MTRSSPKASYGDSFTRSFARWRTKKICLVLLALMLLEVVAPRASAQVSVRSEAAETFAEKSLTPGSDNSIWKQFPYNAAAWREESEAPRAGACSGSASLQPAIWAAGAVEMDPCPRLSLDDKHAPSTAAGSDGSSAGPHDNNGSSSAQQPSNKFLQPVTAQRQSDSAEWGHLLWDSTKFLMFLHAYRLANEKETREGLSGPFFKGYADAVASIHGWNDGDPFETNYINHPMEGGVAGYLWVAHDPRYRQAEFGRSSEYWKSRLRAMAYAAAFSLQFEIGPISEASIGNVQDAAPGKNGIVDWVITPTVGFLWMVGEDAMDQFVIKKLEVRTTSRFKRLVIRSALNPTRSMANMMQGKPPWNRDTRPGITAF